MQAIACPKCNFALNENVINSSSLTECNSCSVLLRADIFPAVYKNPEAGLSAEALTAGTEASCFYHPKKRAVSHCEVCGRFLCALCDLEINDQHLCSACLEVGQKKKKITNLENHRILYDKIALLMGIMFISAIPLGIGMVWTWPLFINAKGILYRNIFGIEQTA